jgi:hypothetical protein
VNKAFSKFQNFSDEPIKVTRYQNNNNIININITYIFT